MISRSLKGFCSEETVDKFSFGTVVSERKSVIYSETHDVEILSSRNKSADEASDNSETSPTRFSEWSEGSSDDFHDDQSPASTSSCNMPPNDFQQNCKTVFSRTTHEYVEIKYGQISYSGSSRNQNIFESPVLEDISSDDFSSNFGSPIGNLKNITKPLDSFNQEDLNKNNILLTIYNIIFDYRYHI